MCYVTGYNKVFTIKANTFTLSSDDDNIIIENYNSQSTYKITAGTIYRWFAWR